MKLYVFNPDADMALGNGEENYMAPASIRRMAEDLALLPVWYAPPGSAVLAPTAYNAAYLKQMQEVFPLNVQLVTEPELAAYAGVQVVPWGWNPAIRKRMLKGGVSEKRLPAPEELRAYRQLASRAGSLALDKYFRLHPEMYVCGCNHLIEGDGSEPVSPAIMDEFTEGAVLKSLWSGSGKGLFWCRNGFSKEASDWCRRALAESGGFMIEPVYDKVEDFAMEFYSNGRGAVSFAGYSRFVTNDKGAYCGNILTTDRQVEEWIRQYVPHDAFMRIRTLLQAELSVLYGNDYTGYLGVDMMVCRQKEGFPYAIHPYVEINLRMNMGVVSRLLCDNFIAPGHGGRFSIDSFPSNEALIRQHEQDMRHYPLTVKGGKVISGYLPLVPVTSGSRFRASVCVEGV